MKITTLIIILAIGLALIGIGSWMGPETIIGTMSGLSGTVISIFPFYYYWRLNFYYPKENKGGG